MHVQRTAISILEPAPTLTESLEPLPGGGIVSDAVWPAIEVADLSGAPTVLHAFFERQVDRDPARAAVEFDGEALSYQALDERANQLAWYLRRHGVGPNQFVALQLPRSTEVYVAILGILKAGAAYLPLDPGYPAERIAGILGDSGACAVITVSQLPAASVISADMLVVNLDRDRARIAAEPVSRCESGPTESHNAAYAIYTSGSTGRPKGVVIEHHSVCNLVRAEGRIFGVHSADRVYQGFSVAFDASVEEIWLAFYAGATLVAATPEMARGGPDLASQLTKLGVTVLSCVPTLLSMMTDDLPAVRLLILGGETCAADLVRRWWRPGRRVVNTYGPTEATVIATFAECHPHRKVTIGRPIPNSVAYVLDEQLRPVPIEASGELCLGGAGVARGYLGREDAIRERFVVNPDTSVSFAPRLYRTGDLARVDADGNIEFLGRVDRQVKIRGFRIEPAEIEEALRESDDVQAAVVTVGRDPAGLSQLLAYVTCRNPDASGDRLRAALRRRLPAFMIPARIEILDTMPLLPSGKVDLKSLPQPGPCQPETPDEEEAANVTEAALLSVWRRLFAGLAVGLDDDFFLHLGGHSLTAASMVSELRRSAEYAHVSMRDVYECPSVRKLAARIAEPGQADDHQPRGHARTASAPTTVAKPSRLAYHFAGLAQVVGLYFLYGLFSVQWLAPFLAYSLMEEKGRGVAVAGAAALSVLLLFYPLMLALVVVLKWVVIGKYKAGTYPLWGWYYLRFWFVSKLFAIAPVDYLNGTPLLNLFYRLLGARIGRGVHIAHDSLGCFDLISVGDGTCIGADSSLLGYRVSAGALHIGPIVVGRHCYLGARAVLAPNTRVEDNGRIEELSLLPEGKVVGAGETWAGSPARRVAGARLLRTLPDLPSRARRAFFAAMHGLASLLLPAFVLAAIFPGLALMTSLDQRWGGAWYLLSTPIVGLLFVTVMALEIVLVKRLLLGRVKPGTYRLDSFFFLRKWFFDQLMDESLDVLTPLYASLYLAPWYRLLGAKLGRRAEISTAAQTAPDLLEVGDESFVADAVALGTSRVEDGRVSLAPTRIGRRAFVGNSALVVGGTDIGDDALIGVLTKPAGDKVPARTSWLGSPAVLLPNRQTSAEFGAESTFRPTRRLIALRASIEFVRILAPASFFVLFTATLVLVNHQLAEVLPLWASIALFPVAFATCAFLLTAVVVACKWLVVGRYRPAEKPLWSDFVWRNELVTALHDCVADPLWNEKMAGTPFAAFYYRWMGARVGSRVFLDTTEFTEYDLVEIGDDVALNSDCTVQTHLFEDRVMKMSTVRIGNGCTVGGQSVVLYGTEMHDGSSLDEQSLLMKGEVLPAGSAWIGIPARPLRGARG